MRVVITGATGNVGTSLLRALGDEPAVDSITGIARRVPAISYPKTTWARADVARDPLVQHFRGADVVVHLAWLIQPSRDARALRAVNVDGSRRVFEAAADAGVPALVYASSVGAYSPGPKDRLVDESWPIGGVSSSFYSRHKAETEQILDVFEQDVPSTRVVRLRPALIFKRDAASGVRRLFAGPFLPASLLRRRLIPVIPNVPRLAFQAVHSLDVGEAYRLAITRPVRGAFNIAADPVLDPHELADLFDARPLEVSPGLVRAVTNLTWRMHLQPTPPGWVDLALQSPLLDSTRARDELGWAPGYTAREALADLIDGMRAGAGIETPPLAPSAGGPARIKEILTGVGRRNP
jgi:nucleoside-diphosphate-sugar epimerase